VHEINGSITINVKTRTDGGVSVIAICHDTNEVFEFPYFVLVGFADGGEYVTNNCTIPQVAQGLRRLHELYDELSEKFESGAKVKDKPKLRILNTTER
jgi:hypothetical protein